MRIAWCSLDEDDADPARFWAVVSAALAAAGAPDGLPDNFSEVNWTDPSASHGALTELLVALGSDGDEMALVLEDVHTVQDSLTASDGLSFFIRNLPENVHVVATSRTPLRIPLAKLRMEGRLLEVGEEALRFTREEEAELFAAAGVAATADDLARIYEATGGWPAASRLLALRCAGADGEGVERAIEQARDNVGEYLLEEVVAAIPADQLHFMVLTSVADSFDGALAAAVCGEEVDTARARIDDLMASGLFVQRLPGTGRSDWFRYHALLLDVLRERLKRLPEGERHEAARRARDWYLKEGYDDAAVSLSYWMRDWEAICDLIAARWRALYMNDSHETVLRWALTLPADVMEAHPFVCAAAALPQALVGGMVEANALIHQAMLGLEEGDDFLFAFCMAQKAYLAVFQEQWDECRDFAERALRFLPDDEYYLRGYMMQLIASSMQYTDPVAAKQGFVDALDVQRLVGNANLVCSALGNLAVLSATLGQCGEAERYAQQALAVYDEAERPRKPMLAHAFWARAVAASLEGDDAAFDRERDAYGQLAATSRVPSLVAGMNVVEAKRLMLQGEEARAVELFASALGESSAATASLLPSLPLLRAWLSAHRGNLAREVSVAEPRVRYLQAALAYAAGDFSVLDAVDELVRKTPRQDGALSVASRVLACALAFESGRPRAAVDYLRGAFAVAEEDGLAALIAENAAALAGLPALLRQAEADEAQRAGDGALARLIEEAAAPAARAADLLTARELEIMAIIADGASVAQAADILVVSRETVKKHLGNIYAKLGVHSKMQAVALLRDEGAL